MAKSRRDAQLEHELGDVRKVIPWKGVSPRVLTKSFELFSFTAEGMGRLDLDATPVGDEEESWSDPDQLFLFISGR